MFRVMTKRWDWSSSRFIRSEREDHHSVQIVGDLPIWLVSRSEAVDFERARHSRTLFVNFFAAQECAQNPGYAQSDLFLLMPRQLANGRSLTLEKVLAVWRCDPYRIEQREVFKTLEIVTDQQSLFTTEDCHPLPASARQERLWSADEVEDRDLATICPDSMTGSTN